MIRHVYQCNTRYIVTNGSRFVVWIPESSSGYLTNVRVAATRFRFMSEATLAILSLRLGGSWYVSPVV